MIKIDETKVNIKNNYKLVSNCFECVLEEEVNKLIEEGYLPYGNMVVWRGSLIQPMIKTDIEEMEVTK